MSVEYYVDAENVGIFWTRLDIVFTEFDKIYVFNNNTSPRLSKDFVMNCPAEIETITLDSKGHNDLDILIAGIIGTTIIKGNSIRIISNDTGYNSLIKYFSECFGCDIDKISIPEYRTKIGILKRRIDSMPMKQTEREKVFSVLDKYQYTRYRKSHIYDSLCKNFGKVRGLELYNMFRKYI